MTTKPMRSRVAIWFLAALLPSHLRSQTPVDTVAAVRAAQAATQHWLALVDSGHIAESWEQAATVLQLALTRIAWEQAVKGARAPFEPFAVRRQIMAVYVTDPLNAPPGQYVLFQYQTAVSGGRQVIELVYPTFDGERGWRVSGYFVRPDEFYDPSERSRLDSAETRRFLALQQNQATRIREASLKCRESAQQLEAALRQHRAFLIERAGMQFLHGEFLQRALQAIAAGDSHQPCAALVDSVAAAMVR